MPTGYKCRWVVVAQIADWLQMLIANGLLSQRCADCHRCRWVAVADALALVLSLIDVVDICRVVAHADWLLLRNKIQLVKCRWVVVAEKLADWSQMPMDCCFQSFVASIATVALKLSEYVRVMGVDR